MKIKTSVWRLKEATQGKFFEKMLFVRFLKELPVVRSIKFARSHEISMINKKEE